LSRLRPPSAESRASIALMRPVALISSPSASANRAAVWRGRFLPAQQLCVGERREIVGQAIDEAPPGLVSHAH